MRRLSQRESVLLGYAPKKPFPVVDHTSEPPHGDTDVDFSDVFGGPPRRSSIHEIRFSIADSSDYSGLTSAGSDKPVFGEEGVNRRRCQNDHFFDDIFRGDESPVSSSPTPRRNFRDPFCSSPGSRVMSPLPPEVEPFGTSLPAPSSFPAKLSIRMELPTFGSPASASLNRGKDGCPNGSSSYSYSPLTRSSSQLDLDQEDKAEGQDNPGKDSNGSQVLKSSSQFHFSIYKWAGSGVPPSITFQGGNTSRLKPKDWHERGLRSEGCTHCESSVKGSSSQVSPDDASSIFNDRSQKSFRMDNEKGQVVLSKKSLEDREQCEIVEEILSTSKSEVLSSSHTVKNDFHRGGSKSVLKAASDSLLKTDIHDRLGKDISNGIAEVQKPPVKSLNLLSYDNTDNKANEEIAVEDSKQGIRSKITNKSSVTLDDDKDLKEKMNSSNVRNEEIGKMWTQAQPQNSGDHGHTKGKGKVKDFVKMFSQESSAKPKLEKVSQSNSSSWKERTSRTENEASTSTMETDKSRNVSHLGNRKSSPDVSFKMDKLPQRAGTQYSAGNETIPLLADVSEKKNSSTSAPASGGLNTRALDVDGSFEESFTVNASSFYKLKSYSHLVFSLIQEITHDEKHVLSTSLESEKLQVIDSKIRHWSHEKEGNIRSLLSTLQYVLWPDSGWKPVPLVDIIEGNAVRRSYQRALLCVHPDKLQQKGATLEQKYTAEKLYDILQDAWTQFSCLGLI